MTNCKYDPRLKTQSQAGMEWLVGTLRKIVEKGETHCSYELAIGAAVGLNELREWMERAHELLHKKDDRIEALTQQVSDLTVWVKSLEAIIRDLEGADDETQ